MVLPQWSHQHCSLHAFHLISHIYHYRYSIYNIASRGWGTLPFRDKEWGESLIWLNPQPNKRTANESHCMTSTVYEWDQTKLKNTWNYYMSSQLGLLMTITKFHLIVLSFMLLCIVYIIALRHSNSKYHQGSSCIKGESNI